MLSMNFKEILSEQINERALDDELFLLKVSNFSSIEDALTKLGNEYIEYFSKHEKRLKKPLSKLNLLESAETAGHLGFARPEETVTKKIKYKGEIILVTWDNINAVWVPEVAKRSIVQALRYGKFLVDSQAEKRDS